ncbi:DUF5615 family PIN-like protein [Algoriphagus sp.]|uniref:DUF5615 family PIN-like protein n=1 Tax=Algoriphagus sp. TaxID=1872435 RepID=UPI0039192CFF
MKFLLDANIPPSLAEEFSEFEVHLSSSLPKGNASKDSEIITYAFENELILITKDIDFFYSFIQSRKPQKVILVKLGNMKSSMMRTSITGMIIRNARFHLPAGRRVWP